jgi:EPS-associated MarR family transcriptional regulator
MDDATNYHLLKTLETNPELTQRDLAREMGFSLGKTNYCLRALMDKGLVKAANFKSSRNKTAYIYKLTPQGIEEKARVTYRFLKRKQKEYEELKQEIEELREEADKIN